MTESAIEGIMEQYGAAQKACSSVEEELNKTIIAVEKERGEFRAKAQGCTDYLKRLRAMRLNLGFKNPRVSKRKAEKAT